MEVRNLTIGKDEEHFNCEINHPVYGWIPYSVIKTDTEEFGRTLYQDIINGIYGEPQNPVTTISETEVI